MENWFDNLARPKIIRNADESFKHFFDFDQFIAISVVLDIFIFCYSNKMDRS